MTTTSSVRSFIRRYTLQLAFAGSFTAGLVLYLLPPTRDFGVNFLTEMSGVWITVFLINKIIERRERERRVAIDLRIYREVQSIIASFYSIWKHLAWKYSPGSNIATEADLEAIYPTVVKAARLTDSFEVVSIHDPESWKLFFHHRSVAQCFENYYVTVQDEIRSTIDNFKIHIEPELLGILLEITESAYFRELHSLIHKEETDLVLAEFEQDTNALSSYLTADITHLKKVSALCAYSRKLRLRLAEFSDSPLAEYKLSSYFVNPVTHHQR